MPTKRRKHKGARPFRGGPVARREALQTPGEATTAQASGGMPAVAPASPARAARPVAVDAGRAMLLQHQNTAKELRRIALITGSIFVVIIILSFILPRLT